MSTDIDYTPVEQKDDTEEAKPTAVEEQVVESAVATNAPESSDVSASEPNEADEPKGDTVISMESKDDTVDASDDPEAFADVPLRLTEEQVYRNIFKLADKDGDGAVGFTDAKFLAYSGLPKNLLGKIWTLANTKNQKELQFPDFCIACRLIALAQQGKEVTLESLAKHAEERLIPRFRLRAQNPLDRLRKNYKCVKCGQTKVDIAQTTLFLTHKTMFTRVVNKFIEGEDDSEAPLLVLTCLNCGYVEMFNEQVLKLKHEAALKAIEAQSEGVVWHTGDPKQEEGACSVM
mmetsp:Transcript_21938/g.24509  ORF Transcript_21938/g.24509 Transcript_21938/m.24509 type:complete len:290 (+) Transcript_21938:45-914(+)